MSAFDRIDRQHRPKPLLKAEPPAIGDPCPDPRCSGAFTNAPAPDGHRQVLVCSMCRKEPRP